MITIETLYKAKANKEKFSCLALYDATMAALADQAGVDILLAGDSLGMVIQGKSSTLPVTMEHMVYHTECIASTAQNALLMADMPFASYNDAVQAVENGAMLMRAGAHMVKLEGKHWLGDVIPHMINAGIPVCAHLGLTPQSVHLFGGYKVQGKNEEQAEMLYNDAIHLQASGANMLLLECVPADLARVISSEVDIPVIGIGAGWDTDGQILVAHDMLGMRTSAPPRFVENFLVEGRDVLQAMQAYVADVQTLRFPAQQHTYS